MDLDKVAESETLFYTNGKAAYEETTTKNGKPLNGFNGNGTVEIGQGDHAASSKMGRKKRCSTKRILKICAASTITPIVLLGLLVGGYLLYTRLTYNPPPSQYTNQTALALMLDEMGNGNNSNGSSVSNVMSGYVAGPWTDCGSVLGKVLGFFVQECPPHENEAGRCALPLEQDGNVKILFQLKGDNTTIVAPTFEVCGKAVYTGTPCRKQPFSKPDPCVNSGIECPLRSGRVYAYHNYGGVHQKDLPVKIMFDTVADIYFRLRDSATSKTIICVRMPAIVDLEPYGS